MWSVKPGRGPSMMNGIISLATAVFGIGWIIFSIQFTRKFSFLNMGVLFPLVGVICVVIGLAQAYYHFTNAVRKNRFSEVDVTNEDEEPDPLNQRFGPVRSVRRRKSAGGRRFEGDFCPYCRARVRQDFDFCPKCGKDI